MRSVRWILARDRRAVFCFAALQSEAGRALVAQAAPNTPLPDSIILLDKSGLHTQSDAVLRILAQLGAPWSWLSALLIIPRAPRDALYRFVAARRYRWFGRTDVCPTLRPEWRSRFLDAAE